MPITPLGHTPSDVLAQALIDLGLCVEGPAQSGWPVHVGGLPASPGNAISVEDTVGYGNRLARGEAPSHPGFQVMVRSEDKNTGMLKASQIRTALAESIHLRQVALEDARYLIDNCAKIGEVLPLGWEDEVSKRELFSINAVMSLIRRS